MHHFGTRSIFVMKISDPPIHMEAAMQSLLPDWRRNKLRGGKYMYIMLIPGPLIPLLKYTGVEIKSLDQVARLDNLQNEML